MKERFTRNEDIVCAVIHIFSLFFTLGISVMMDEVTKVYGTQSSKIAFYLFAGGYFLYFISSVIYHFTSGSSLKKTLRKINIVLFFVCLFCTYVPFEIVTLSKGKGIFLMIFSGLLCIVAAVLNVINPSKFKIPTALCFIFAEITLFIFSGEIINNTTWVCLAITALCALLNMSGALFYTKNNHYFHVFWHSFFMVSSMLQSLVVLIYVLPVKL